MKTYQIPGIDLPVSRLSYGCMRLGGSWGDDPLTTEDRKRAVKSVAAALERGINIFDHADIYMRGKSETVFAEALQDLAVDREQIVLQSKCGIRFPGDPSPHSPGRYDFSYEHIIASVEGILRRLETDYLDILLLHRPDPLVEPEEVARLTSCTVAARCARLVSPTTPARRLPCFRRSSISRWWSTSWR